MFAQTLYLFIIGLVLALLEIQIEGPEGWAAKLPTWRSDKPWLKKLNGGRPVTGYHLALVSLLLLFFHLPLVWNGWSISGEARSLSSFLFLVVFWDFLWFVLNPSFGLRRYSRANIWWFRHWLLGFPVDYYIALLLSFGVVLGGAALSGFELGSAAINWLWTFGLLVGFTFVTVMIVGTRKTSQIQ